MTTIKSKTNTIGFWMTPIMTPIFIGMLLLAILKYNPKESIAPFVLGSIFLVLNVTQLWQTAKVITVNAILGTVTLKHMLTRRMTIIDFKNIDGYVDVIEKPARGRPFRIIFLVKDERFVQKISSFIYSNINEMEEGLKRIPYLGRKEYSYLKNLRVALGQRVLHR